MGEANERQHADDCTVTTCHSAGVGLETARRVVRADPGEPAQRKPGRPAHEALERAPLDLILEATFVGGQFSPDHHPLLAADGGLVAPFGHLGEAEPAVQANDLLVTFKCATSDCL